MSNQQQIGQPLQQHDPEPSEESKSIVALFSDMHGKQLDFLDATGKSLIERIATFLTVLFAVTALSGTFPPAYLKGNTTAKVLVFITLLLFMASLFSAIRAIRPFAYNYNSHNITSMQEALQKMIRRKSRWLNCANWLFVVGSIALSALIVVVIWGV